MTDNNEHVIRYALEMTFPRLPKHHLVIDGETYIWSLKRDMAWVDFKGITIQHCQYPQGQLLLLKLYIHKSEVRPQPVRNAILFALSKGWQPREKGEAFSLSDDNVQFLLRRPSEQYSRTFQ